MQNLVGNKEIGAFEQKLAAVDTASLGITPYAKRYLQHIIDHRRYYCRMYARVLAYAFNTPAADVSPAGGSVTAYGKKKCFVDYGAGNGVLGLMAKFCGVEKVFINDLQAGFLNAAEKLAADMGISIDGFIHGDIDSLKNIERPDIIAGTDVIEHIYNPDHFFSTIRHINPLMLTVMTTASNPVNPFKVKALTKLHLKDELQGGNPGDSTLFGEVAIAPFIETRKKMIASFSPVLTAEEIGTLATLTRGLHQNDIEKAVEAYRKDKSLPALIVHPTNTCDPVTGSWSERIISFEEYQTIYKSAGFTVTVEDGFYNAFEPGIKSFVLKLLNELIPFTRHRLSPFVILVGRPQQ